eukprot:2536665-Rhodomonas_salina.2
MLCLCRVLDHVVRLVTGLGRVLFWWWYMRCVRSGADRVCGDRRRTSPPHLSPSSTLRTEQRRRKASRGRHVTRGFVAS